MQLVILASGKGKRMGDLIKTVPKPMLKIKGKPILEHKLNALPKEIDEIVFVIGYKGEFIMNHFKRNFNGRKIIYVFQRNLNGTGAALHLAKNVLQDRFLVMMGDDLYHKRDIKKMIKHDLAVLGYEVEDITQFGIIRSDKRGFLSDIVEKPKRSESRLANTGLYMLNKNFFDHDLVSIGGGEFGLPQTLSSMAAKHKVKIEKASLWHPIGNQEDLKKAEEIIHKFI
jgi:bifunctional UDP-N-acetylglucosamine pyrophosphorylase/glucosamine-1-phosphate N-acetyltransferase